MFHAHHHRSLFPLAVVAITVALAAVVLWLYVPTARAPFFAEAPRDSASPSSYKDSALRVLFTMDERLALAATLGAREDVVSAAGAEFLALRVPVESKDAHLQMVIALDSLRRAYAGANDARIEEAIQRLANLRASLSL
ncbi:hypothetical protein HYW18_01535 [Candidatus Uhrbacteria bacterium]|nr:hypothetical protein [Candidatus Uhrbacteria bacterium]